MVKHGRMSQKSLTVGRLLLKYLLGQVLEDETLSATQFGDEATGAAGIFSGQGGEDYLQGGRPAFGLFT